MSVGQSGFQSKVLARRRQKKRKSIATMNLVSLMDIFTILVFFLLVNSSNVEVLPGKSSVTLPKSVADAKPAETIVVTVSNKQIMLQGEVVAKVSAKSSQDIVPGLFDALNVYRQQHGKHIRNVTILGDKGISYALLKRVMTSCARAQFSEISLAVEQTYRQVSP